MAVVAGRGAHHSLEDFARSSKRVGELSAISFFLLKADR
jgi:hypothetical protein